MVSSRVSSRFESSLPLAAGEFLIFISLRGEGDS